MKITKHTFTSLFIGFAAVSSAQWSVTYLKPAGTTNSAVYGLGSGMQLGQANGKAVIWHGSAGSTVNMNPGLATGSIIQSYSNGIYAGWAVSGSTGYAGIWTSASPASFINLNPANASSSSITTSYGNQQGGSTQVGSSQRAGLWSGSVASFVDLTPGFASDAVLKGMGPNQQVGWFAYPSQYARACTWAGSAGSVVDLDGGQFTGSWANATDGSYQVGMASFGSNGQAVMWNGSAGSWSLLAPFGAKSSEAFAVSNGYQVGVSYDNSFSPHASLWQGTSASWFDLGTLLPANYKGSYAYSLLIDNGTMYVGGYAVNVTTNEAEAILWTKAAPVPEPASLAALALGALALFRRKR